MVAVEVVVVVTEVSLLRDLPTLCLVCTEALSTWYEIG